ncbi:CarboxypepD_reg-like domain-containing protein [Mucilaginibacter pineti]|uniref:CarboxypepD_reg-like domain-containing protein n=1 Tax=Mucilaginibacter pineti TaxID=1391627 RepID=A0A1G7CNW0_9SPHI|nr:carboxypeptidase-like regulatory domain-containing protein [Mucilaginibacter pineti]SDE40999.1 CarboxypepD_reg-like domain-containing protein [Mucilaginibacter pineti]
MRLSLIILFLVAPLLTFAQSGTITGKVINAETQAALPKASVFLTETSYGTITNDGGTFTLNGLKPGRYLLIVTMVGFEKFSQEVSVGADAVPINISLKPHVTSLGEVSVRIPEDWERNYKMFVKKFVGTSACGRKCKILNSEVLNFSYNKKERELSASSDDLIEMENRALGYMVKILLTKSMFGDNHGSWNGQFFFEDLPGTPEDIKQWKANRIKLLQETGGHFVVSEKLPNDFR